MRPSRIVALPHCGRHALIMLACIGTAVGVDAAAALNTVRPLAGDSVYQLNVPLTDQNGLEFQLDARRGKPLLITMFYSSCQFVCPRIIDALKRTEQSLTPAERSRVPILAVTFDPERDDLAALKSVIDDHRLDPANWTVARTDPATVRKFAAALGIKYRALANGDFNHTSVLILLDADGRIAGKTFTIGAADPVFVKLVKKTLAQPYK
jgi:protein SCO1/2